MQSFWAPSVQSNLLRAYYCDQFVEKRSLRMLWLLDLKLKFFKKTAKKPSFLNLSHLAKKRLINKGFKKKLKLERKNFHLLVWKLFFSYNLWYVKEKKTAPGTSVKKHFDLFWSHQKWNIFVNIIRYKIFRLNIRDKNTSTFYMGDFWDSYRIRFNKC